MIEAEFQLQAEIAELRRQVAVLREERERWRRLPVPLTAEEREAVAFAICSLGRDDYLNERHAEQLAETLERLKERLQ